MSKTHNQPRNRKFWAFFTSIMAVIVLLWACGGKKYIITPAPAPNPAKTVTIAIDRNQQYQQIDGFGFFGAMTVWWDGNQSNLYNNAWGEKVIKDMGITIWRNEYVPEMTPTQTQDADWNKQRPVVEGLNRIAKENRVPLKFIFSIWSPPAHLKCALDANDRPLSGTPHPQGTKQGGTLDPAKYAAFADWITAGIKLYKDVGIDLYAFSPQNEPLFKQFFNSCYYKPINEPSGGYNNMIKQVIPLVKAAYPNVKVFGSENMLAMEGGKDRQWFYNANLMKDAQAMQQIDILALHGYQDGVTPTASSQLASLWKTTLTEHMVPAGRPCWMTETSGYFDVWDSSGSKPGAFSLAKDIFSALYYGNVSAWVWWQGSDVGGIGEYALMSGLSTGKKYAVSKHFYRFIRPGARRVGVSFNEADGVFATAFEHKDRNIFTVVLINDANSEVKVVLSGNNLPASFDYYLTTSSASDNCLKKDVAVAANSFTMPPKSMVTLVNGNVYE